MEEKENVKEKECPEEMKIGHRKKHFRREIFRECRWENGWGIGERKWEKEMERVRESGKSLKKRKAEFITVRRAESYGYLLHSTLTYFFLLINMFEKRKGFRII